MDTKYLVRVNVMITLERIQNMKYKYIVEFESEHDLMAEGDGKYDPIDIVEPSVAGGVITASKHGVGSWWYGSCNYAISWKIISQQEIE